jgi:putative spermidine/putrescine transport system permease protein
MTATVERPDPADRAGGAVARGPGRRASRFLARHPRARLGVTITAPMLWLLVAYVGALAALLLTSLYSTDPFTFDIVKEVSLDNFRTLWSEPVYRSVTLRSVGVAATVTLIDTVIGVPAAFFMAKVASPASRKWLVVALLMPLWASYLVKAYAWRSILDPAGGVLEQTFGWTPGFGLAGTTIVLAYLWLPYMVIPLYAGLERLPDSLLEASSDMGAKAGRTFRSVVLPILWPALVAGSIFTFSLSLGDYIAVQIVGGTTQMIGNVVYRNFGSLNTPFAAAYALVPVAIMLVYLFGARRTGALENL